MTPDHETDIPDGGDIGHDHFLRYFSWSPDRELNPQYDGIPDEPRAGAIVEHLKPDGSRCTGAITFKTPVTERVKRSGPLWDVLSWDPLTTEPSVLCRTCGDHGHIRGGAWCPV